MEFQTLFNAAVGCVMLLSGWFMRVIWDSIKQLHDDDRELSEKVSRIEVLVAGEYVKRDEFDRSMDRLFDKLNQIEKKIDSKADK
jgi:hypothetical protein